MKIVFDASNSLQAHLIKGVLNMHEIEAFIQGEYLQGGTGELPMTGLIKVCVADDDYIQAQTLIDAWEANKFRLTE